MTSGGADSACVAAGLAYELGSEAVHGLHLNYGLRAGAGEGEQAARGLCAALRIDLHVERPSEPLEGNLQDAARRDALRGRRAIADAHRVRLDRHRPHPDRRRRDGRLPARELARDPGAARARAAQRPGDPAPARARARACPRAGGRGGAPVRRRRDQRGRPLRAQPDPRRAAARASRLEPGGDPQHRRDPGRARRGGGAARAGGAGSARPGRRRTRDRVAIRAAALEPMEPGLRRLALRALAERALGRPVVLGRAAGRGDHAPRGDGRRAATVELGGGLVAECESGFVRFAGRARRRGARARRPAAPRQGPDRRLGGARPSSARAPVEPAGPDLATLDAARARGADRGSHLARGRPASARSA